MDAMARNILRTAQKFLVKQTNPTLASTLGIVSRVRLEHELEFECSS